MVDLKLEVVVIPVTDVDRAKQFYAGLGWRLDADFPFGNGFRVVQFTPPGAPGSGPFGAKITTAAPVSAQGMYLVVSDIQAAVDELEARGAKPSEVFHPGAAGAQFRRDGGDRVSAGADDGASYSSFATFSDPDGNGWLLQEITKRLPGRIDSAETAFASDAGPASTARPRYRRVGCTSRWSSGNWSAASARTGPAFLPSRCCARARRCRARARPPPPPKSTSRRPWRGGHSWYRTGPTPARRGGRTT